MKITKTKAGTYTGRVTITDESGKRHYKRITGKNKAQVKAELEEYELNHKVYMESTAFCDAAQRFIAHSERILSPSTVRAYRSAMRITEKDFPLFWRRPVDRITRSDIQTMIDTMSAVGRTPKTVSNRIGFISAVMSHEGFKIPPHTMPKPKRYDPKVPSEETVKKVAAAAAGTRYEIPFALAVFGLRCGEICAVRAEDISEANVLHVHRALVIDDDGLIIEKAPKEYASDRFIEIPPSLADAIRKAGRATTMSPKAWSDAFPHLLKKAGIPPEDQFRLHDCRHFFVSYCHDVLRLSDAQIIKLSGHRTDYVMKRVYRHAITDSMAEVSGRLAGVLS